MLEEKGAWDTMVWMGSLVGLADYLNKTGFIPWFAKSVGAMLAGVSWIPALAILLVAYLYSHYGFASLSAHVTAMYSAFLAVAVAAGAPPYLAALSLAFMSNLMGCLTHYATGPAPVYFGAGILTRERFGGLGSFYLLSI